jgi:hypothetical protein
MRFNVFYQDGEKFPTIFDGEATSVHTRGNVITWVSYCITEVVQICMKSKCIIERIDKDGSVWLMNKGE